ncbi:MAG: hypothetical protein OHK0039_01110 [Bacteroidia bacterium]
MNNRLDQLLAFLQQTPDDPFTRYSVAYEYMQAGDHLKAVEHFTALRAIAPDYTGLYYHLGKCLEGLDREPEARDAYRDGIARTQALGQTHARQELERALQQLLDWDA